MESLIVLFRQDAEKYVKHGVPKKQLTVLMYREKEFGRGRGWRVAREYYFHQLFISVLLE